MKAFCKKEHYDENNLSKHKTYRRDIGHRRDRISFSTITHKNVRRNMNKYLLR